MIKYINRKVKTRKIEEQKQNNKMRQMKVITMIYDEINELKKQNINTTNTTIL